MVCHRALWESSCRHVVTIASAKKTLVTGRLLLCGSLHYPLGPKIAYPLWAGVGLAFAGAGF